MLALLRVGCEVFNKAVNDKLATVLGICLGMQLLLDSSEKGSFPSLGLVSGRVSKFDVGVLILKSCIWGETHEK